MSEQRGTQALDSDEDGPHRVVEPSRDASGGSAGDGESVSPRWRSSLSVWIGLLGLILLGVGLTAHRSRPSHSDETGASAPAPGLPTATAPPSASPEAVGGRGATSVPEDPTAPPSIFEIEIAGQPPYPRVAGAPNRLADAPSAYLQSASEQPVNWMEWGPEAFEIAERLDRPILLDIGAVWCHWCHVMDIQTYENETIAAYINANFVPVKVDRDARPDIDRRYQAAVQAVAQAGGWPLTAFLTPAGKVFFGGTYFPPRTAAERPGFDRVLPWIAGLYADERETIWQRAEQLHGILGEHDARQAAAGEPSLAIIEAIARSAVESADPVHGGWGGGSSKFPNLPTVLLLLERYERSGDAAARDVALKALDAMAEGGMRDHIGGGLFRYSTDPEWRVPHFEKMSYVNAVALSAYAQAWRIEPRPLYRETALGIADYVLGTASRAEGGFYATQDADVTLEDDGSWFTWTLAEAEAVLSPDEARVLLPYYGITEQPSAATLELPDRNVLRIHMQVETLAAELDSSPDALRRRLDSGRRKMAAARAELPAPFVDPTLYANWNGLMIRGFLDAADVFERPDLVVFAEASAGFLLDEMYRPGQGMYHAFYEGSPHTSGLLDDQVQVAAALLDLYARVGEPRYLDAARDLMDFSLDSFWDEDGGGFWDIASRDAALADLSRPHKPLLDLPTPGANAVAAQVLLRLGEATDEALYMERAAETLSAFAGSADSIGAGAASYAMAIEAWLELAAP